MAKSNTVDTAGALLDWRQDVTVRDLKAKREAALREAIKAARERGEILPAYLCPS